MKNKIVFILTLIPCSVLAQEGWTPNDSIKLSKMLDDEIPIYINDTFKKALEQSVIGFPKENNDNKLGDFLLGIEPSYDLGNYSGVRKSALYIPYHLLSDSAYKKRSEYLALGKFGISSTISTDNPHIKLKRNTNLSIPLNRKWHFNIYGSYTLDKKRSVILPATSIPYEVGAGFSYRVGKHTVIKSQTNYQYNLIYKKWEWFFGAGVTFSF